MKAHLSFSSEFSAPDILVASMNSCQVRKLIIRGNFENKGFFGDRGQDQEKAHLKVYGSTVIRIKLLKYLVNKCLCFHSSQHWGVHVHHLVLAHLTGGVILHFLLNIFFPSSFCPHLNESIVPFIYLRSVITSPVNIV